MRLGLLSTVWLNACVTGPPFLKNGIAIVGKGAERAVLDLKSRSIGQPDDVVHSNDTPSPFNQFMVVAF